MINGKYVIPPSLADLLIAHGLDVSANIRVMIPGYVSSYDSAKRTAQIVPGYNRVYNDGTVVPIKCLLVDVPVYTMQGGGIHVGFPIKPGDECSVFFSDINIDAWFVHGKQQTPNDSRRHNLSDGFALVGPNSLANPLLTSLTAAEGGLASPLAKMAIDRSTNLITIAKGPQTLALALKALLTALTSLNTGIAAEGGTIPTAAAAATAANAALVLVQAQLDALLY